MRLDITPSIPKYNFTNRLALLRQTNHDVADYKM